MLITQLNFVSLRRLYAFFLIRVWLHRTRMIVVRVFLVGGLGYLVFLAMQPGGLNVTSGETYSMDGGLLIFGLIVLWLAPVIALSWFWEQFGRDNGAPSIDTDVGLRPSSSFTKNLFGLPFRPIPLLVDGRRLYLQISLYKEGGLLRWREYHMDLSIRYDPEPPVVVPHILADATSRDELKASNLRQHFAGYMEFRAEGEAGQAYRLISARENTSDALAILTPDVLWVLLEALPGVDLELKGGSVWFLCRNFRFNDEQLISFISGSMHAMSKIDKQLRPYLQVPSV